MPDYLTVVYCVNKGDDIRSVTEKGVRISWSDAMRDRDVLAKAVKELQDELAKEREEVRIISGLLSRKTQQLAECIDGSHKYKKYE